MQRLLCPRVCGGQGNTPVRALSGISTLEFLGKKTLLFPLGLHLLEAESKKGELGAGGSGSRCDVGARTGLGLTLSGYMSQIPLCNSHELGLSPITECSVTDPSSRQVSCRREAKGQGDSARWGRQFPGHLLQKPRLTV